MQQIFSFSFWESLDWREGVLAVSLIGLSIFLQRVFAHFLSHHIKKKVSKDTTSSLAGIEHRVLEALAPPSHFVFLALGIFSASQILTLPPSAKALTTQGIHSLLILLAIWACYQAIEPLSHLLNQIGKTDQEKRFNEELRTFLVSLSRATILLVGFLSLLQNWGVNVTTFLAGLGLVGMAVSFAAQDSIKQFFGSIALILDRPFEKGDWVRLGSVEGIVTSIGLRTTTIRQIDHTLAVLPNSDLANTHIINKSGVEKWQVNWTLNLTYATTAAQLETIVDHLKAYLKENKDIDLTADKRFTIVSLDKFNDSSIDIYCSFYTRTKDWIHFMKIKHDCVLAFKKIVEGAGSSFAFPTQSLYVEKMPRFC